MAELNSSPEKSNGRRSAKKLSPRVDLTAMVDLAFLLVTFFMLTTTLAKPKMMDVTMPVDKESEGVPESRTMTICLGKNNQALCYLGMIDHPVIAPKLVTYTKNGLRQTITETSKAVRQATGKDMIVIVKPSAHSIYENLVNSLDELNITGEQRYAIVDIADKDIAVLKQKHAD